MMNFSKALEDVVAGRKLSREGWNGEGQYIQLQTPDENSFMTEPYIYFVFSEGEKRIPWLASQADILAQDWFEVE